MNRTLRRIIALLLMACCLTGASGAAAEDAETFNLLLIGLDAYDAEETGRSDAMMLAQITPSTGDVKLISFLRDLYVSIPGHGRTRLNAAYVYGGAELLKRTLEENFHVRIDRTAAVNFSEMANMIDQIGGIEVEITKEELRELNDNLVRYNQHMGIPEMDGLLEESGLVRLSGVQALSFSRIRSLDSDFGRTGRQQQVLLGILRQLTTLDLFRLMGLAITNLGKLDTDLTLGDIRALAPLVTNGSNLRLRTAHVPFDGAYRDALINNMWVLEADLPVNTRLIQEFLQTP